MSHLSTTPSQDLAPFLCACPCNPSNCCVAAHHVPQSVDRGFEARECFVLSKGFWVPAVAMSMVYTPSLDPPLPLSTTPPTTPFKHKPQCCRVWG